MKKYAVLTGDLVKSSRDKDQRDLLLNITKNILRNLKYSEKFFDCHVHTSNIFRGDSFQIIITNSWQSLRLSLYIRSEFLRNRKPGIDIDTRMGVGIGTIESLDIKKIEESYGQAFQLSGEALDYMVRRKYEKYRRLRMLTPEDELNNILDPILACLDAISNRWTVEQAEALSLRLIGNTQTEMAKS